MSAFGYLKSPVASALLGKRRRGGLAPLVPLINGNDQNIDEVSMFTYAYFGLTPKPMDYTVTYNNAVYVHAINLTPAPLTIQIIGEVPTLTYTPDIQFTGASYHVGMTATFELTNYLSFEGRGYISAPEMLGGFLFEGTGYKTNVTFTLQPDYNAFFTGRGYRAGLNAQLDGIWPIAFTGRGYKVNNPELLGGFIFTGRGYDYGLSSSVVTSERITFTGRGYAASLTANVNDIVDIQFTGRGYKADLWRQGFTGRGYKVEPLFSFAVDSAYAEAYVMNILTNEVTRYTEYPFFHIAKIGSNYYGINENGLYLIDHNTLVGGSIRTADTDFADDGFSGFQSKNVSFAYLNSDTQTTVTPYVDGAKKTGQKTHFSGRRVVLGRGNRGRYWSFKIDNIQALQGIEYTPDKLSRRVK